LFNNWLEDYKNYAKELKDRSLSHHMYFMNEGVQENLRLQCLPLDYFIERMLQIGLVGSMPTMKQFIAIMLQFDNPGFTNQGPDAEITRT